MTSRGNPLDVLLADGSAIRIRPIRPADVGGLQSLHSRLSERSQYRRFFGVHPRLSDGEARHFASVDHADREAFVAISSSRRSARPTVR